MSAITSRIAGVDVNFIGAIFTYLAKNILGPSRYESFRNTVIVGYDWSNALLPFPPMIILLPIKIAIIVLVTLFCIYGMQFSVPLSIFLGYIVQVVLILSLSGKITRWMSDNGLTLGF